jgi:ribosomal protein L7Ae-like RNA K-turn-binding protein
MDSNRILSLLGLALRGGNLAVGEEPVEAVARARDARVLLLASDAADNTRRRVEHFAQAGQCLWLRIPFTKAELGQAVGRSSAAIAAVTDIGLATAVVRRLAELDPARYDEAAAKLELKAKRAAERKAEQLAHEKNLRQGKRKPKKAPLQEPESPQQPLPAAGSAPRTASRRTGAPSRRPVQTGGRPRTPGAAGGGRSKPRTAPSPYAHSRPVKKGKGSFRKKESQGR